MKLKLRTTRAQYDAIRRFIIDESFGDIRKRYQMLTKIEAADFDRELFILQEVLWSKIVKQFNLFRGQSEAIKLWNKEKLNAKRKAKGLSNANPVPEVRTGDGIHKDQDVGEDNACRLSPDPIQPSPAASSSCNGDGADSDKEERGELGSEYPIL